MPYLIWFDCSYFTHHQFEKISQDVLFISPDVTQFLKLAEGSNNLTTIKNSNDDKFHANDNSYIWCIPVCCGSILSLVLILFWGMLMYDNEFETKENKIWTKD